MSYYIMQTSPGGSFLGATGASELAQIPVNLGRTMT
jgi:hypothetical protein